MGSFNMTCFASQRTISGGNQAFIMPIFQQATYTPAKLSLGDLSFSQFGISHSSCYPNAFWDYAGPIIEGTYEDYGNFNLTENNANQSNLLSFFKILHEKLFKVEEGANSSHDLPIDFQSMYDPQQEYSFEELAAIWHCVWEVGQENRLFLNVKNTPRQLQFALIHQKTVNFFEKYCSELTFNDHNLDQLVEDFIDDSHMFVLGSLHKMALFPDMIDMLQDSFDFGISRLANLEGIHFATGLQSSSLYDNSKELKECIVAFAKKNPTAKKFNKPTLNKIKKICATALKHRIIHFGLDSFNIKLAPPAYGYQDYNNSVGKSFLHFINAINGNTPKKTKILPE